VPLHTLRADVDFRRRDRVHHLRHLRRQGLDLQGRDHGARPDGAGQENGRGRAGSSAPRRELKPPHQDIKTASHAATDQNQVPQGAQRPHPRPGDLGRLACLRRVRPQGDGAGARHRAPDRSRAARADASHEARRPRVDPGVSDVPVTKKPLEVRMGSGKGGIELWVTRGLDRQLGSRERERLLGKLHRTRVELEQDAGRLQAR